MNLDTEKLRTSIAAWLERMAEGLEPGRFRFCSHGSLVPVSGQQAQFATCFAMKIAWQIGIWDSWSAVRREGCLAFVKSFQRADGWFVDQWLARQARLDLKERVGLYLHRLIGSNSRRATDYRDNINIRAESRQSASTLLMVEDLPGYPLPIECSTSEEVSRFIHSFDWSHPWSAGSHLSHLLFMLSANEKHFPKRSDYAGLIDTALVCLAALRDSESGCWCKGSPDPVENLNGAMKVFSGLQWLSKPYPDCRRLMDFALDQRLQDDGCSFLNQLFVVYHARLGVPPGYREEDVRHLGHLALARISRFVREDGAFSFFEERAQTHYYGANVSQGAPVADLHGTTMMTWATAIALALSAQSEDMGRYCWRIHCA